MTLKTIIDGLLTWIFIWGVMFVGAVSCGPEPTECDNPPYCDCVSVCSNLQNAPIQPVNLMTFHECIGQCAIDHIACPGPT